MLVSTTDTKGVITHCNSAFIEASGFSHDELLGQPHNLVRHPDMPPEAYKDMWRTIGRGEPWTGLVKNRRKNGDHYWVRANVTPIMEGGKPRGYLSVRTKPSAKEVAEAEVLYARMRTEEKSGQSSFRLRAGEVRRLGLMGLWDSRKDVGLVARMAWLLAVLALLVLLPDMLAGRARPPGAGAQPVWWRAACLCCGAFIAAAWPGLKKPAALRPMWRLAI